MAISLGAIVVVGIIITSMKLQMGGWLSDVWNMVTGFINKNIQ